MKEDTKNEKSSSIPPYAVLHVERDRFKETAIIHWGVKDVGAFTLETPLRGEKADKDIIIDALKCMADPKSKKTAIFQPISIDVCFFPKFAKKILEWLENEMRGDEEETQEIFK